MPVISKTSDSVTDGNVYGAVVLQQLLQTSFARLAHGRIASQDALYRSSVQIQPPCPNKTLFAKCLPGNGICPWYDREAERDDYRERCQILLNQIRIIDHQTRFSQRLGKSAKEIEEPRRFWLEMLANCLFPPTAALGSKVNVNLASLHGGPEGLTVLRRWLSESFDRVSPGDGGVPGFMRDVQRVSHCLAELFPTGERASHLDTGALAHYD